VRVDQKGRETVGDELDMSFAFCVRKNRRVVETLRRVEKMEDSTLSLPKTKVSFGSLNGSPSVFRTFTQIATVIKQIRVKHTGAVEEPPALRPIVLRKSIYIPGSNISKCFSILDISRFRHPLTCHHEQIPERRRTRVKLAMKAAVVAVDVCHEAVFGR